MPHTPIPDIPGELLQDETTRGHLNEHISRLCNLNSARFPGSQPVSFSSTSLELLESLDFWVCEKSDGVRILVFIVMNGMSGKQEVWLVSFQTSLSGGHGLMSKQIDRKQRYFKVEDLHFPHWERKDDPLTDTILDGELVIDIDPETGTVSGTKCSHEHS